MSQISATYALRRFTRSTDRDYQSALGIYVTNIKPDSRTNSNEITHWLDNYKKKFQDEFCVCGFYSENKIIGYAQFVFFKKERLLFFDYLVLHKSYRTHGEYFQFAKLVQNWVDNEKFEFDYAIAEVSYESSGSAPSDHSVSLVELFKFMGFMVADCCYYQPVLGLDNPESDKRAHLLIASREKIGSIKRETLLKIVNTITFQHYERWYKPLLDAPVKYKELLTQRFREFEKSISGKGEIELNGVKPFGHPALLPSPAPKRSKSVQMMPALFAATVIWILCLGLLFLQFKFGVSQSAMLATVAASLVVFTVSFVLIYPKRQPILKELLSFISRFFGRGK